MENKMDFLQLENEIVSMLKTVYDPEIPVNIYDLGLIYQVNIDPENHVEIVMTLTSPNCPIADSMLLEINEKLSEIPGVKEPRVTITFDPPWDKEMLSEEAKLELGLL